MIAKVQRGRGVRNLLAYLYGPGKANEHTDPHVVAGFMPAGFLEPAIGSSGRLELSGLTAMLEANVHAAGSYESKHVWHCSVAIEAEAGLRSDEDWAEVARALVAETGIDVDGDAHGCAWVAVRHGVSAGGNDHIHVVATLARPDGTREKAPNDYRAAGRVAKRFETEWGTRRLDRHAGSAAPHASRAELEKGERLHQVDGRGPVPSRRLLKEAAQSAAAGASSFEEFRQALEARGVLVSERESATRPGETTGYALAMPGDVDAAGSPVSYGGSKLAADLSYRRLHERWASPAAWAAERRELSRRQVAGVMRQCAAASTSREDYLERLQAAGVEVRLRHSTRPPARGTEAVGDGGDGVLGKITGYAVRTGGPRADAGGFEGAGRVDSTLSWPRLHEVFGTSHGAGLRSGAGERAAVRLQLLERASTSSTLEEFLDGLRQDGLAVETTVSGTTGRVSGYRVGRPGEQLREARDFGADLSPQRLTMTWRGENPAYDRSQREQLEKMAIAAVKQSTDVVRGVIAAGDPAAAAGTAAQARDLLETMARATEARGTTSARARMHLEDAARTFDRAARDLDRAPAGPTHAGDALRVTAVFLSAAARAGDRDVSLVDLALQTAMLVEAIAALREAQGRRQEAEAALAAAASTRRSVDELARVGGRAASAATRQGLRERLEEQARRRGAASPQTPDPRPGQERGPQR